MTDYIKRLSRVRGFTLVELLIVIAVIGILAIAVLAALDPIEQLKKSRDTGRLSDSRELLNAYTRYYSTYGCYPENNTTGTCATPADFLAANSATAPVPAAITAMVNSGELKQAFAGKRTVTLGELHRTIGDDDTLVVCFVPESKASRNGAYGALSDLAQDVGGSAAVSAGAVASCDLSSGYDGSVIDDGCMVCLQ